MSDRDDAFGHWLAGFIDGEGSFIIHGAERKQCRMCVKLRADDRAILDEIVERTGIGRVTHQPNNARTNPQYGWLVITKADCQRLVALLERYPLRAKKARDFEIWREAVRQWVAMAPRNGHKRNDWTGMAVLQDQLMEGRRFSNIVEPLIIDGPRLYQQVLAMLE